MLVECCVFKSRYLAPKVKSFVSREKIIATNFWYPSEIILINYFGKWKITRTTVIGLIRCYHKKWNHLSKNVLYNQDINNFYVKTAWIAVQIGQQSTNFSRFGFKWLLPNSKPEGMAWGLKIFIKFRGYRRCRSVLSKLFLFTAH